MPVVETTIIEGYDARTKARLMKAMMRAVLSVMAAKPDGIVTVLKEVKAENYARGGVGRVPGPPLPAAEDVLADLLAARKAGASERLAALAEPTALDALGAAAVPESYDAIETALGDDGSAAYCRWVDGEGRSHLDRYRLQAGRIVSFERFAYTETAR